MFAERMRNLVPHHGGELVIGDLKLLDEAGIDRYLTARHAPRVDLVCRLLLEKKNTTESVFPEDCLLRDDAVGNPADAFHFFGIVIHGALRGLALNQLLVLGGRCLVHLGRRHKEELATVNTYRAFLRRRPASAERHRCEEHYGRVDNPSPILHECLPCPPGPPPPCLPRKTTS